MKIRYIKDYPDNSVGPEFVFKAGWTAEHDQPTAKRRIKDGFCIAIEADARARKTTLSQAVVMECVQPATHGLQKETPDPRHKKQ